MNRGDMNIDEYKNIIIKHFQSGTATQEQWNELADACLGASEDCKMPITDKKILTEKEYTEYYLQNDSEDTIW